MIALDIEAGRNSLITSSFKSNGISQNIFCSFASNLPDDEFELETVSSSGIIAVEASAIPSLIGTDVLFSFSNLMLFELGGANDERIRGIFKVFFVVP